MDEWKYGQIRGRRVNEGSTDEENSAALTLCKVAATAWFIWVLPVSDLSFSLMKGFGQEKTRVPCFNPQRSGGIL